MHPDPEMLRGLPSKLIDLPQVPVEWKTHFTEPFCSFGAPDFFPPGSIMIFETQRESVDLISLDTSSHITKNITSRGRLGPCPQ